MKAMASSCKLQEAREGIFQRKFPMEVQLAVLQRVPTMFLKSKQSIIREKLDLKPQKGIDKFVTVTGPEGGHLKKANLHSLKVKQAKNQPL